VTAGKSGGPCYAASVRVRAGATAIVERSSPPIPDPVEDEYYQYITSQASRSLERVVSELPGDLDYSTLRGLSKEVQQKLNLAKLKSLKFEFVTDATAQDEIWLDTILFARN